MPGAAQGIVDVSLGIDYGTSCDKVAFQLKHLGQLDKTVKILLFDGSELELPAHVAWHDGKFFCGWELEEMIRDQKIPVKSVIQFLKMAIHDESGNVPLEQRSLLSKHIFSQLKAAGKTLQETLDAHMKAILAAVQFALRQSPYFRLLAADTSTVEINFLARLSVPQQWTTQGCQMMVNAAAAAGLEPVDVVSEPQCSLAELLNVANQSDFGLELCKLKKGSQIVVNDLGCGTSDVVLYELLDDMGIGSRLQAKDQSAGAMCGSQKINEIIYMWIVVELEKSVESHDNEQALEEYFANLGMTGGDFRWHALASIEDEKKKYPRARSYTVSIPRSNGDVKYLAIPAGIMEFAQNSVIQDIVALNTMVLAREGQPDVIPDAVVITGGHASSKALRKGFSDYYNPKGIDVFGPHDFCKAKDLTLVAAGALSNRYEPIQAQALPTHKYAFAFLLDEKYDNTLHTDCKKTVTQMSKQYQTMDHNKVFKVVRTEPNSVFQKPTFYAPDRIVNVIRKGETEVLREDGWLQQYDFCAEFPVIQARFVRMTGNLDSGAPARDVISVKKREVDGELRAGLMPLSTVTARVSKELLVENGVHVCQLAGEGDHFSFKATMKVAYKGEKELTVSWEICTPSGKIVTVVGEQSVWDGKRSPLAVDQDHVDTTQR
ncbi:hypothetical protein TI39_contig541g00010 [Zymoseptoria brevis]|uniref:Uncharacterized protein n=1 Tax=Zymoseptoria brevis TaxID=1047168 RepID=A0A0F4GIS0_9PEZI|nr:hypothetical protein TI39_contig541g00010 [Zymoseptoria brevis]